MNSYVNMGVGALLGTVFVLMSVSIASEGIFHSGHPEKEGFAIVAEETGGEAAGGGEEAKGTPIATLLASADAAAGETAVSYTHLDVYKRQGWRRCRCRRGRHSPSSTPGS